MAKPPKNDPLAGIEKAQEKLRENIEESKQLCEQTQRLLKKAREDHPLPE